MPCSAARLGCSWTGWTVAVESVAARADHSALSWMEKKIWKKSMQKNLKFYLFNKNGNKKRIEKKKLK